MKTTILNLTLFLLITFSFVYAQNKSNKLVGYVKDKNNLPLEFVNVYILNSVDGSMTDINGYFSFSTKQSSKIELVASMIGYDKYSTFIDLKSYNGDTLKIVLTCNIVSTKEVIITASSFGSEKGKGVVMTNMDIVTTPGGAADIFQALKTMPGLTQVSESAELYIRGGDPIETTTLLDQASLNHPYTFESSYGGLFSNINTSSIKGMYFSSGGFSAKYGNALSGVLDLETKNEPNVYSLSLGVSLGSLDFKIEKPLIDDVLGIRLSAKKSYVDPIFWLNGNKRDFTLAPTSQDFNTTICYKFSQTGRIKTFASYAQDKQGVVVQQPGYNDEFTGESDNLLVNTQVSELLSTTLFLKSSFSYSKFYSNWKLGVLNLDKKDHTLKFRSDAEWTAFQDYKFLFGFEMEKRKSQFLGTIPSEDYDLRENARSEIINASFDNIKYGAYGEGEFSSLFGIKSLFIIAGVRTDYISKLNLNWIDPRFNLGYKINEITTVSFGWGIFHQHPDPRLFSNSDGNPNLKAMKAIHYIASFNYKLSNNDNIRIEAFYKKYSGLPLEDTLTNYSNKGFGYAKGIDVILKGSLFGYIDGWISYGLIDSKRKWMDYENLSASSYDITHNFTIVAKFNITNSFQVGLNYKFATGKPYTPALSGKFNEQINIYEPVYAEDNSARYPNYQRLDLRLTYLTTLFQDKFSVFYVEALNILNIKNIFDYSYSFDYSSKKEIGSYFGRRTIVFGAQITL
ncbi:MAG: carboxypeptidase-like regulatory domain-containing protein [bacterium]